MSAMRGLAALVFMTFAAIVAAVLAVSSRAAPVAAPQFAQSPAMAVDTELVLAVDVSYSMDLDEQAMQREGYVQALMSREFMQALKLGTNGRVAITYFEWANVGDQKILLPWRLIDGPETADAVAAELAAAPYRRASRTSISGGRCSGNRCSRRAAIEVFAASSTCRATAPTITVRQ